MHLLRPLLLLALLTACGDDKTPSSTTGTTDLDPTGTAASADSEDPTSGDPFADDDSGCENFLPPIEPADLPPGKVGAPYEVSFTMGGEKPAGIVWEQKDMLPPGLTFDADTVILAGTPTTPGDYTVELEARVDGDGGDCPTAPESRTYPLTIAP